MISFPDLESKFPVGSSARIRDGNIIYTKTRSLKAELIGKSEGQDLPVNLDGEIGGYCPVEFNNLQQHIEFYVGG